MFQVGTSSKEMSLSIQYHAEHCDVEDGVVPQVFSGKASVLPIWCFLEAKVLPL
jgi:hypothetical protein